MANKELVKSRTSQPTTWPELAAARNFGAFDSLQNEIDRVFDMFNGAAPAFDRRSFLPRMEVTENDSALEIAIELPGMDEKDIDINVSDGMLTIRGEKKVEKDEKKKSYRLIERSYGSFERSVALPAGVDASKVKARMAKGVLTVEAPKPPGAKTQQIKIATD
jgi:HSP20 family protein